MINEKVVNALNRQMNRELYSAYLYLSMASYVDSIGLKGFASWFKAQGIEEAAHADKLYSYVVGQGGRVILQDIEAPPKEFGSGAGAFQVTLEHEKKVTSLIHGLVALAKEEKDKATEDFLQWFVKEQVEEEHSASRALEKAKSAGDDKDTLAKVDTEFAKRKP